MAASKITGMPDNLIAGSSFIHEYANEIKTVTNHNADEIDLNKYTLPTASDSVLGGIKVGSRLSITDGVLSADEQSASVGDDLILTTGSNAINLTNNITGKQYALYDMASGALTLTAAANPVTFGCASGIIRADGSTTPNVSAFTVFSGIYDNTNDVDNHWFAIRRNGVNYLYWSQSEN